MSKAVVIHHTLNTLGGETTVAIETIESNGLARLLDVDAERLEFPRKRVWLARGHREKLNVEEAGTAGGLDDSTTPHCQTADARSLASRPGGALGPDRGAVVPV